MTWIFPITSTSSAVTVDLGTMYGAWVLKNVVVTSSGGAAINGTGSAQEARIEGEIGGSNNGIVLGEDGSVDSGDKIAVFSTGEVVAGNAGVSIYAHDSSITNNGYIYGGQSAAVINAQATSGSSTLTNYGTLTSDVAAIDAGYSTQEIDITNYGVISGAQAFGGDHQTSNTNITNNGSMIGDVVFSIGDDTYDGRNGSIKGRSTAGMAPTSCTAALRPTDSMAALMPTISTVATETIH